MENQTITPPTMTEMEIVEAAIYGAGYNELVTDLKVAIFDIMKNGLNCVDENATPEQYAYFVNRVLHILVEVI